MRITEDKSKKRTLVITTIVFFLVSGDYDNPSDLVGASVNRNGLSTTGSLKFAAGACYDNPDNTAFFENPLSAPRAPQRNDSLEQHPAGFGDSTYDNPSSPKGTCNPGS